MNYSPIFFFADTHLLTTEIEGSGQKDNRKMHSVHSKTQKCRECKIFSQHCIETSRIPPLQATEIINFQLVLTSLSQVDMGLAADLSNTT